MRHVTNWVISYIKVSILVIFFVLIYKACKSVIDVLCTCDSSGFAICVTLVNICPRFMLLFKGCSACGTVFLCFFTEYLMVQTSNINSRTIRPDTAICLLERYFDNFMYKMHKKPRSLK